MNDPYTVIKPETSVIQWTDTVKDYVQQNVFVFFSVLEKLMERYAWLVRESILNSKIPKWVNVFYQAVYFLPQSIWSIIYWWSPNFASNIKQI